jgi:hypothetical protein
MRRVADEITRMETLITQLDACPRTGPTTPAHDHCPTGTTSPTSPNRHGAAL